MTVKQSRKAGAPCKYPWPSLRVGGVKVVAGNCYDAARRSAHYYAKRHGWKISITSAPGVIGRTIHVRRLS